MKHTNSKTVEVAITWTYLFKIYKCIVKKKTRVA